MRRKQIGFWLFILPAMLAFVLVVVIPAVTGFYYSFTDWNGIGKNAQFIGITNYIKLFDDGRFWDSFLFTLAFAVCAVICINVVGFGLALLVTSKIKGSNLARTVFFMPNLIGGILLGFTWQFIFVSIFEAIGKKTEMAWLQGWLSDQKTGFIGMLIVLTWQLAGYMMIIYIAQLESIPDSFLEAARVDGASSFKTFMKIKLPLVAPAFTIGLFLSISDSFKMFDQNLALTAGGPANSTEMIALNIYNTAFKESKLGIAQAKAVVFLIIVVVISLTQLYLSKRKEVEM
ncbi:MAG: carbohydrate ABC transporter permease [Acetatifactor sp.]